MGEIKDSNRDTGEQAVEQSAPEKGHLAEGVKPIMACVGTWEQYRDEISDIRDVQDAGNYVDFYDHRDALDRKKFKNAGRQTYVISTVNDKPKYTKNLCDCTSLVAVGREQESGVELSLLTHQDPKKFLGEKMKNFAKDLEERLNELKSRCEQGTVDIVLLGGNVDVDYAESVQILALIVQKVFGFQPDVIVGPKEDKGDGVYLDTFKRRVYVVRPPAQTYNDTFKPNDVEAMKAKWKKEKEK